MNLLPTFNNGQLKTFFRLKCHNFIWFVMQWHAKFREQGCITHVCIPKLMWFVLELRLTQNGSVHDMCHAYCWFSLENHRVFWSELAKIRFLCKRVVKAKWKREGCSSRGYWKVRIAHFIWKKCGCVHHGVAVIVTFLKSTLTKWLSYMSWYCVCEKFELLF
jgi:hypothetical protein